MAAANYITIADYKSIWSTQIEVAQFALIGVRMAEILNHRIYKDATHQVVDTAHTPILEQISEECLISLIAASKEAAVTNPWDFLQANVMNFMRKRLLAWKPFLDSIQIAISQKHDVKYSNKLRLPSHSD